MITHIFESFCVVSHRLVYCCNAGYDCWCKYCSTRTLEHFRNVWENRIESYTKEFQRQLLFDTTTYHTHLSRWDMELFKSTRARLERVGIQQQQPWQESHSVCSHLKRVMPICCIILAMLSSNVFFLFESKNFGE